MRKTTTPNMALRPQGGWRDRLGDGSSRRFTPLGLILMLLMTLLPNMAKAQSVDGLNADQTFDFLSYANEGLTLTDMTWGDNYTGGITYNTPKYIDKIGTHDMSGRFATGSKVQNGNAYGWFIRSTGITGNNSKGLWGRNELAFCGMWNGDRVRVTLAQGSITFLEANSAKMNGSLVTEGQTVSAGTFVFAAARDGDVIIKCNDNYTVITKVEFFYSGNGYSYNDNDWSVSFSQSSVDLAGGATYNTNNANVAPNWVTPTFTSSNERVATVDANGIITAHRKGTATITATMAVGPEGAAYTHHHTATMTVNVTSNEVITPENINGYDPAVETYDFYWVNNNSTINPTNLKDAGNEFKLDVDDLNAQYLTGMADGTSLNDRFAISQVYDNGSKKTPWNLVYQSGLTPTDNNWHNMAICNLTEGDRVVIYYKVNSNGQAPKFSSKGENTAYNGCAAFIDYQNDGEYEENIDDMVACGMSLEFSALNSDLYTSQPIIAMENGHLDIAVPAGAIVTKVIIYGDHQAQMVDRYNGNGLGHTSYFNTTGQLEAKHHIVPGGLNVYIGNDDLNQHAEIVSSDKGPVSFVYDQNHFKMARHATYGSFNVWKELPATGTFYKFVPEVDGYMTVYFKANSINYRNYDAPGNGVADIYNTPNEVTNNANCPYYIMKAGSTQWLQDGDGNWFQAACDEVTSQTKSNGADVTIANVRVEKGQVYYLYGWWDDTSDAFGWQRGHACGVAELIEVTFIADNSIFPLAKWVETGTTADEDLADVTGTPTITIKKKSANIADCEAYLENGKLKIRNISFVDADKGGGTILIKVGDKNNDADPVFAYTIAYNANYKSKNENVGTDINNNVIYRSEGHTWNFSDRPLVGLKWNNKNAEADEAEFGPYFNNFKADFDSGNLNSEGLPNGYNVNDENTFNKNSFLHYEMNKQNPDGTNHSDWQFNYRVKKNGKFYDPRFLNLYDMEGDNADMMWDTEGLIINAGSAQSCLFDEFKLTNDRVVNHKDKTQGDPDRYIGFLPGGEFIIPCLKKDDRVLIYMGSGYGSGAESMTFKITNARDAVYKIIDENDKYHIGGSMWNVRDEENGNHHDDPEYRGCYHFFALADGDMKFHMEEGTMCKLYTIKIYRGARENTNGIQEAGNGYTILTEIAQDGTKTKGTNYWNLHFRGKGESIAENNEVLTHSGNITNLNIVKTGSGTISYTNEGEIGMLRARVKCMDYDHKYVTDFADRNFTLALHETMKYPYTWDFTDVHGFAPTAEAVENEEKDYNEITDLSTITATSDADKTWYEPLGRELSMWDTNGAMVVKASTEEYANQNMIFENCKGVNGNQLWAGGAVIPETQGLWWYMDNNDNAYNGSMQVVEGGLKLSNTKRTLGTGTTMGWWNYKMVVPSVPADHVVYLRMTRDHSVSETDFTKKKKDDGTYEAPVLFLNTKFNFGTDDKTDLTPSSETLTAQSTSAEATYNVIESGDNYVFYNVKDGVTDDWVIAVKNTKGAASNLTFTLNGWILKKLSISADKKTLDSKGWASESREHVVDPSLTAFLTGYDIETCFVDKINYNQTNPHGRGTLKLRRACFDDGSTGDIIRASAEGDFGGCLIHYKADTPLSILDGGFHLFVPDMHDYANERSGVYTSNDMQGAKTVTGTNLLKAQVGVGTIPATDGDYTNYILSNQRYIMDQGDLVPGPEAFYRVKSTGATSKGHNAYLQLLTEMINPSTANGFILTFGDGDADGINEVYGTNEETGNSIFTIDGKKLETMPTRSGVYIVNGKKVVIK